jgi:hypothetical protein
VHVGAGGDLLADAGLKTGADLASSGTDGGFGLHPECIEAFVEEGDELLFISPIDDSAPDAIHRPPLTSSCALST